MKVLIWGTGENTRKYLGTRELKAEEIVGFIESKPTVSEFEDKHVGRYKVFKPADVKNLHCQLQTGEAH